MNHALFPGPSSLETIGAPGPSKIDTPAAPPPTQAETQSAYEMQLAEVPEFASYGSVINSSSKPAPLTDSETEYQVTCIKHIFKEHIVFQVKSIGNIRLTLHI
jgi:coatomer subunit gamma